MFGREYLDWCAEVRAGETIDAFLADMESEDRKWALAVMRKRHEVRVEYRDHPLSQLGRVLPSHLALQNVSTLARDLGL